MVFGYALMRAASTIFFVPGFAVFAIVTVRGIKTWRTSNASRKVSAHALPVARRTYTARRTVADDDLFLSTSPSHYATFEFDTGDRMEFALSPGEYGKAMEGQAGTLTFQGTRFLSFERDSFQAAEGR